VAEDLRRGLGRLRRRHRQPPGTLTRCQDCPSSTSPASAAECDQRVPEHARDQVRVECNIGPRRVSLSVPSSPLAPGFRSPWDLGCGRFVVCRHVPAADARELEEGVDGGFERAGVALNLGEEEAALKCGEEGDGEVVRVGAVREVPGGVKTAQPVADGG